MYWFQSSNVDNHLINMKKNSLLIFFKWQIGKISQIYQMSKWKTQPELYWLINGYSNLIGQILITNMTNDNVIIYFGLKCFLNEVQKIKELFFLRLKLYSNSKTIPQGIKYPTIGMISLKFWQQFLFPVIWLVDFH